MVVPSRAAVEPAPPRLARRLPWIGAGAQLLRDPAAFFAETRGRLGDTYLVDAFGYRLFCVFSPAGVRALYAVPEDHASFGLATRHLLSLKLPPELFEGRRTTARTLFGGDDVQGYLANLEEAIRLEIAAWGAAGTFEVFSTMRRLGHRLGLASWIGPEAAAPPCWNVSRPSSTGSTRQTPSSARHARFSSLPRGTLASVARCSGYEAPPLRGWTGQSRLRL